MVHLNRFIQIPLAEQMSTQMPSGIGMKAEAEKYKDPYYAISIQEKKKKNPSPLHVPSLVQNTECFVVVPLGYNFDVLCK